MGQIDFESKKYNNYNKLKIYPGMVIAKNWMDN
jgi:hypothetical protein